MFRDTPVLTEQSIIRNALTRTEDTLAMSSVLELPTSRKTNIYQDINIALNIHFTHFKYHNICNHILAIIYFCLLSDMWFAP